MSYDLDNPQGAPQPAVGVSEVSPEACIAAIETLERMKRRPMSRRMFVEISGLQMALSKQGERAAALTGRQDEFDWYGILIQA